LAVTYNQKRNHPVYTIAKPRDAGAEKYPRSTPMPGGGITFPAGALLGSLPIVDCTAGFRIIQSWSAHPESDSTNAPIANERLINFDLLPSGYEHWGNLIDYPSC
jgi:hypothetical protein